MVRFSFLREERATPAGDAAEEDAKPEGEAPAEGEAAAAEPKEAAAAAAADDAQGGAPEEETAKKAEEPKEFVGFKLWREPRHVPELSEQLREQAVSALQKSIKASAWPRALSASAAAAALGIALVKATVLIRATDVRLLRCRLPWRSGSGAWQSARPWTSRTETATPSEPRQPQTPSSSHSHSRRRRSWSRCTSRPASPLTWTPSSCGSSRLLRSVLWKTPNPPLRKAPFLAPHLT